MSHPSKPALLPYVRHLLLCDKVSVTGKRVTLHGLFTKIEEVSSPFPRSGGFSVCLVVTEGRKSGQGRVRIVGSDDGLEYYEGRRYPIDFDGDPLKTYVFSFRIARCTFPRPALYLVEFVFDDVVVAQEPLLVR